MTCINSGPAMYWLDHSAPTRKQGCCNARMDYELCFSPCRLLLMSFLKESTKSPGKEDPLAQFRCYFLGSAGKIQEAMNFEADELGEAVDFARAHCMRAGYGGFEIWQGPHRLHKEWVEKPERVE